MTKRVLEPIDRVSEVLFGLIMVLTFTGSLSVADAGRDDVRTMLVAAMTASLATNSGQSAWFPGVMLLMVYAIFAMTLYMLPPRVA